jgi:hypothetical protein
MKILKEEEEEEFIPLVDEMFALHHGRNEPL